MWIAQQIAGSLKAEGIDYFFDDSDMKLGDAIDARVKDAIKTSTHFIVLMTPGAWDSKWVPAEIAMADLIDLKIIPLVHYVDKNKIFELLINRTRYDLNSFGRVLNMLKSEMNPEVAQQNDFEPEPRETTKEKDKFLNAPSVGSAVRLPTRPPSEAIRASENIGWVPGMNPYLGKAGEVLEIDEDNSAKLDVDGGKYWYAFEWLESVN